MTEVARTVLTALEALSPADQRDVAAEILSRVSPFGDLPEEALLQAANELFCGYDAEETEGASVSRCSSTPPRCR